MKAETGFDSQFSRLKLKFQQVIRFPPIKPRLYSNLRLKLRQSRGETRPDSTASHRQLKGKQDWLVGVSASNGGGGGGVL